MCVCMSADGYRPSLSCILSTGRAFRRLPGNVGSVLVVHLLIGGGASCRVPGNSRGPR